MLTAVDAIRSDSLVIEEQDLIDKLHLSILEMVDLQLVSSIQACVKPQIKTALQRLAGLGMVVRTTNLKGINTTLYRGAAKTQA